MKKTNFITFILFFVISSFAFAQAPKGYRIEVKINGIKDTVCKMAFHFGAKKLLEDTAVVDSKGNMVFEGDKPLKGGIYLITVPNKGYFEFIGGEQQFFSMSTDTSDLVKNMKIKGSDENIRFYNYLNFVNPKGKEINDLTQNYKDEKNPESTKAKELRDKVIALNKEVEDYKDNIIKSYPNSFLAILFKAMKDVEVPEMKEIADEKERNKARYMYFKNHYFDNFNLADSRILRTPIFESKLDYFLDNIVVQMPDSINKEADFLMKKGGKDYDMFRYLLIHITSKYEKSSIMCMSDAIFHHMADNYYTKDKRVDWVDSTTMVKIKEQIVKTKYSRCGLYAPNLILPDTTGKTYSLGAVKAEYTVLYFWSATCGHCKKATPKLYEMYKRLKPYGVQVYTVHIDDNEKALKSYLKEHKFDWITTNAPNNEFNYRVYYDIYSTPVIYVLDKDKKIIAKRIDVVTLEKILSDKLGVTPPEHILNHKEEEDEHGH